MLRHRVRELRLAMALAEAAAVYISAASAAFLRFGSLSAAADTLASSSGLTPRGWPGSSR